MNDNMKEVARSWALDPEKFILEALLFEERGYKLTTQQKEALYSVKMVVWSKKKSNAGEELTAEELMYSKKIGISVMSGKGTGKDAIISMIILWFICCFPEHKIPCTANSGKQLKEVLWAEIGKWLKGSAIEDQVVIQSEKVYVRTADKAGDGKKYFATARTVNVKGDADALAATLDGFHCDNMMIVVDEAAGIPDPVFKPFETTLTGPCNFVFMIFNPTRSSGYAVDSHGKNREDWVALQWSAEDSELALLPQFAEQIKRTERKYGRDSNVFRVNILGKPPATDSNGLIPFDWVMEAVDKEMVVDPGDPVMTGVDVGAGGDASIILHRQGGRVEKLQEHNTKDTMLLVGWVKMAADEWESSAVFVDNIGIGLGVYNRLRELGVSVYAVDVRRVARRERFAKLRDELWWIVREQFELGLISIPNDAELIAELTSIKYEPNDSKGEIKIESKKDMKRRGVASPNKADALCLSYYLPDSVFAEVKATKDPYGFGDEYEETPHNTSNSFMAV